MTVIAERTVHTELVNRGLRELVKGLDRDTVNIYFAALVFCDEETGVVDMDAIDRGVEAGWYVAMFRHPTNQHLTHIQIQRPDA